MYVRNVCPNTCKHIEPLCYHLFPLSYKKPNAAMRKKLSLEKIYLQISQQKRNKGTDRKKEWRIPTQQFPYAVLSNEDDIVRTFQYKNKEA